MPPLRDALLGILLPAIIGLIAGFLSTRGEQRSWWRMGLGVLGAGLAYAAARWSLWGWKPLPPPSVFDWLAWSALGIGLVGAIAAKATVWIRAVVTILLGIAILIPVVLRDGDLTTSSRILVAGGCGLLLGITALIAEAAATRAPITSLGGVIAGATVASITLLMPLSSASQAQSIGMLCAALGGTATALLLTRRTPVLVATFAVLLIGAALTTQQRFATGSILSLGLLALAPAGLLLGLLPPLRDRPWLAAAARIVGVLIIAGTGAALAFATAAAKAAESPYGPAPY